MIIDLFEEYGNGIEIDSEGLPSCKISLREGQHVAGVGAIVDGVVIALYGLGGRHVLRIGDRTWCVEEELDQIVFVNENNGVSRLLVGNKGAWIAEVAYRSWWIRLGTSDFIAIADDHDSERDFGAYLAFMWETSERRTYLMERYSG